eukprot:1082638-Prymnesium_polylepis.2
MKVLEPAVTGLADTAAAHCRPKSADKTASEQCALDWVRRHLRYCSLRVATPCRRHQCRPPARSLPADSSPGALGHEARAIEAAVGKA